jgi:hypothetical protein
MKTKIAENYVKQIRGLMENEIEQAEVLILARGFAQDIQTMIEKVGRMQNEDLGPVVDQIRDNYGNETADAFNRMISDALQGVLDNMKETQTTMNNAVSDMAEGRAPGSEVAMDLDDEFGDDGLGDEMGGEELPLGDDEFDLGDDLPELDDEFGGDPAMAGPEDEPLGHARKESIEQLGKALTEAKALLKKIKSSKK